MKLFSTTRVYHFLITLLLITSVTSCKDDKKDEDVSQASSTEAGNEDLFFDLSLAQWSLNKPIFAGELDPMDFAEKANELGFEGIEYVNQFYTPLYRDAEDPKAAFQVVLDSLKSKSEQHNVQNVLIMVDGEGDLATADRAAREQAVENHKKWVDAADFLGCHSIRVNLFGSEDPEEWKENAVAGLTQLSEYAVGKNINVLVENHGSLSSNAQLLVEVMEEVNMENCGTLPDFGNFCIKNQDGCLEEYDKYQGVRELMEHAKAVSAKSYDFDEAGQETTIDYQRMLKIVKDAGYSGFIGIEYEGDRLPPEEGILATKNLLLKAGRELKKS